MPTQYFRPFHCPQNAHPKWIIVSNQKMAKIKKISSDPWYTTVNSTLYKEMMQKLINWLKHIVFSFWQGNKYLLCSLLIKYSYEKWRTLQTMLDYFNNFDDKTEIMSNVYHFYFQKPCWSMFHNYFSSSD